MNKTDALNRLAAIENEAKELRKIIEAPEVNSLLTKPSNMRWHVIADGSTANFTASGVGIRPVSGGNIFQTEALATAYAEALNTFLLLRHQPGTVAAIRGEQFCIDISSGGRLEVACWGGLDYKTSYTCPCFATAEDAQRAIDTIGADRILKMFRTFHGLETA